MLTLQENVMFSSITEECHFFVVVVVVNEGISLHSFLQFKISKQAC